MFESSTHKKLYLDRLALACPDEELIAEFNLSCLNCCKNQRFSILRTGVSPPLSKIPHQGKLKFIIVVCYRIREPDLYMIACNLVDVRGFHSVNSGP